MSGRSFAGAGQPPFAVTSELPLAELLEAIRDELAALRAELEPMSGVRARGRLLSRSDLRDLGLEHRAIDAVFAALPVVRLPMHDR